MTRFVPIRYVLGLVMALSLAACGGGSPGVDETAAQAGVSSDTTDEDSSESQDTDADTGTDRDTDADTDEGDGNPGGPGDDDGDGGGNGGGDEGDGNPGGPGDVTVFEERGIPFADFRDGQAREVCVKQHKCTLAEPVISSGEADPQTGADQCTIADIQYDPPARPNPDPEGRDLFQVGATVIVQVTCPDGEGTDGEGTDGEGTDGEGTDGEGTDGEGTDGEGTDGSGTGDSGDQTQG
jgi:hypothetical protein